MTFATTPFATRPFGSSGRNFIAQPGGIIPYAGRIFAAIDALLDFLGIDLFPTITARHPAGATLDYSIDYGPILPPGVEIVSYTISASGVTVGDQSRVGNVVTALVSGGVPFTRAAVTITATDDQTPPRVYPQVLALQVVRAVPNQVVS